MTTTSLQFGIRFLICAHCALSFASASERLLVRQSGPEVSVTSVAISNDGSVLATSSFDGRIRFHDPRTGKLLRAIDTLADRQVALSPDGKSCVTAGFNMDKLIKVVDVTTGKRLHTLAGHTEIGCQRFAVRTIARAFSRNSIQTRDCRRLSSPGLVVCCEPCLTLVAPARMECGDESCLVCEFHGGAVSPANRLALSIRAIGW